MDGTRIRRRWFGSLAALLAFACADDGGTKSHSPGADAAVEGGRTDVSGDSGKRPPDTRPTIPDSGVPDSEVTPPTTGVKDASVDTPDAALTDASTNPEAGAHFDGVVPASGGTVDLGAVATVTVPAGAFGASQTLGVTELDGSSFAELFDLMSAIFSPAERAPNGLRVASSALPAKPLQLTLPVPASMTALTGLRVFARLFEGNEEDLHDRFVPVTTSRSGNSLSASLDPASFRTSAPGGGVFVDVVIANVEGGSSTTLAALSRPAACPAGVDTLGPPLATLSVKRNFNVGTVTTIGETTVAGHPGTDFVAADGEPVKAPGCGMVVQAKEADVSQGKEVNGGAGGTVVIQMPGIGRVQYMHLKAGTITVTKGQFVSLGDVIGKADSTGFSTGSHLHMEFRPFKSGQRMEPMNCIDMAKVEAEYQGTLSLAEVQPALTEDIGAPAVRLVLDGCNDTTKSYKMAGKVNASNVTISGNACTLVAKSGDFGQTGANSAVVGTVIVKPELALHGVDVTVAWRTEANCVVGPKTVTVPAAVSVPFTTLPSCTIPTDPILRDQIVSQPIVTLDALKGDYVYKLGTPEPGTCVTTITGHWNFTKVP